MSRLGGPQEAENDEVEAELAGNSCLDFSLKYAVAGVRALELVGMK